MITVNGKNQIVSIMIETREPENAEKIVSKLGGSNNWDFQKNNIAVVPLEGATAHIFYDFSAGYSSPAGSSYFIKIKGDPLPLSVIETLRTQGVKIPTI